MNKTRMEKDTFGPIEVPAERLWGAQTQRSLQNFDISGERQPREIIRALVQIKRSSAVVQSPHGPDGRQQGVGDHRGGGRGATRRARRLNSARGLADRLGHADQHERERSAGEPRERACSAASAGKGASSTRTTT